MKALMLALLLGWSVAAAAGPALAKLPPAQLPAEFAELVDALELVADEHGRVNKTLQMLQLEGKRRVGVA